MMHLSPEEQAIGKANFHATIGSELTRREFLERSLAAGVVSGAGLGAFYFGYQAVNDPLRIGIIGTGDEGSVLIGALTPDYIQVQAICDIRPYNVHRAFHGDASSPNTLQVRPGLMAKYGWKSEDEARGHVAVYEDYHELLARDDLEGVVIALPLHLHAPVAIDALRAGKHVLTEKLMAHSVGQCKDMSRVAQQTGLHLATGHQRHYSILYDNAVDTIRRGLLGDLHFIRAQWHRGNLPGRDSWAPPLLDQLRKDFANIEKRLEGAKSGSEYDTLRQRKELLASQLLDETVDAEKWGYQSRTLDNGQERSAFEELVRWRLWNRTGGGLMAELGSHQLDAASIFISAMRADGQKVMPLSVAGVGGRHIFPLDRDTEDHVYCTYEFPAPGFEEDSNKKICVTYSSINGNGYGGYGEVVMGTKGTMILEREQDVMLFLNSSTTTNVKVAKSDGGPTLDTTESGGGPAASVGKAALEAGPISRGYTEEIEHWAYCIRNPDPANVPRCHPQVALADAVIALTSNLAMRDRRIIDFQPEWFEIDRNETPEGIEPTISV